MRSLSNGLGVLDSLSLTEERFELGIYSGYSFLIVDFYKLFAF